jgi:putative endonuclease
LGERDVRNVEVRGSIPLGSTSLRPANMKYVYILQSLEFVERYYVGITDDLKSRLAKHNAGGVSHTSKYKPWRVKTYVAFSDEKNAQAFERYLKTASGRAFAKKRL